MNLTYSTTTTVNGEERDIDVFLDITDIVVVHPDSTSWASPDDYYGYKELSFEVEYVYLYDEASVVVQVMLSKADIESLNLDYDKIEAWCWEVLEEVRDDREDYD